MSIKKGSFYAPVSLEFFTDLVAIMKECSAKGSDKLTFILPKLPGMEDDRDMEVTISWRFKK